MPQPSPVLFQQEQAILLIGVFKKLDPKAFHDWNRPAAATGTCARENLESWRLRY